MVKDAPFDIFGWGHDGRLPSEIKHTLSHPGEPERLADELIREWHASAEGSDHRGKRQLSEIQNRISTFAYVLTTHFAEEGLPPPPIVLRLLQFALGLALSGTGEPVSRPSLQDFGYPVGIDRANVSLFLAATELHASAKAKPWKNKQLAEHLGIDPKTLRNWKQTDAWKRRVDFLSNHELMHIAAYTRLNSTPVRRPKARQPVKPPRILRPTK